MTMQHERLAAFCAAKGVRGVVLRRRSNIAWVTGGADVHCDLATQTGIAALLWTPHMTRVLTDTIEGPRLRDEEPFPGADIEAIDWWEPDARVAMLLADGGYATDWPDDPLYELRASLTDTEIARARSLGADTADVVERVLRQEVKPGMTEWHLAGALTGWLRDRGIFTHVCLVASDARIARYRHPTPTAKPIDRCAMAAICAQRGGLIVSLTRIVHFGPLESDLRRRHHAVVAVDLALHGATRVGTPYCDVLRAGIEEYARQGFGDEWKHHHQGGPMGYECRDFKATPSETRSVAPRQLVGWNPTIAGTKSEDTVLASESGVEVLTRGPGDWPQIGGRPDILVR
jgi:Xaa-Pro aminopeptidase